MFTRLRIIGGIVGDKFILPMTQAEINDALGISMVHCNRMIKELRARGLVEWKGNDVNVLDWDRLCELAEFDATYLSLQKEAEEDPASFPKFFNGAHGAEPLLPLET